MSTVSVLEPRASRRPLADDEVLYEVVYGQRIEKIMSVLTLWIASRLVQLLGPFVFERGLGRAITEMLFILDAGRDLIRRPDVGFVSATTWPLDRPLPATGEWEVIPDVAIEVVSPTNRLEAVLEKVEEYFAYGVKQVWLIIPAVQKVYLYDSPTQVRILAATDELDGGTLIPGWRVPLTSIFQQAARAESSV